MRIQVQRTLTIIFLALALPVFLSGCWDSRELNRLLIVTGIALDKSEAPGEIDITIQVGDFAEKSSSDGGGSGGTSSTPTIILKSTSDTLLKGFNELNRDSNHHMLIQHNQIRLFSIELAQQGIEEHLDLFMRDPKARLEVPLLIVDGRAEDVLTAKLSQESISGIFLGGMLAELSKMSVSYRVRMIDYVYSALEKSSAPIIPIVKVTPAGSGDEEQQEIHLDGIAVFRDGKMIGRLDNEDTLGYLWSLGDVRRSSIEIKEGKDQAVINITNLECHQTVTLRPDGGVKVDLFLKGSLNLGELRGFSKMKPDELMPHLKKLAEEAFKDQIMSTLHAAQELNADIFAFGTEVYRKYPKQWSQMEADWERIFSDLELNVTADMYLPLPGQIVQSLQMEKGME